MCHVGGCAQHQVFAFYSVPAYSSATTARNTRLPHRMHKTMFLSVRKCLTYRLVIIVCTAGLRRVDGPVRGW